ncbi:hypothetical protein [Streptomyces sp. NPDC001500]
MDHFERQLAQLMRAVEEPASFDSRQRERLRAGVRSRRRTRAAQRAVGLVLAVAGIAVGLSLLPGGPTRVEPGEIRPQPATNPSPPVPTLTPGVSPSATPSSAAPSFGDRSDGVTPPVSTGGSDPGAESPSGSPSSTSPPTSSVSAPSSSTATARNTASADPSSLATP